jgi:hypothetical protein
MGCCEARKTTLTTHDEHPKASDISKKDSFSLEIPKLSFLRDSHAKEILDHIFELEKQNDWTPVLSDDTVSAMKIDRSKFNQEFIVTKLSLNCKRVVCTDLILKSILEIKHRVKWDKLLDHASVLEGNLWTSIIYKKLKVLFYSMVFVERQFVFYDKSAIFIVSYSVDYEQIYGNDKVNAKNIMTCIKIHTVEEQTVITIINQTDPKSKLGNLALTLGIVSQKQWFSNLQEHINRKKLE